MSEQFPEEKAAKSRNEVKMKLYQLTTRAQINGAIHDPGYRFSLPEGVLGPHKTLVASSHGSNIAGHPGGSLKDEPLYIELDHDLEVRREEMCVRHAEELAKLDGSAERDELIAAQAKENAELGAEAAAKEVETRHARETEELKDRQDAENQAFDSREKNEPAYAPVPPKETDKTVLDARHKAEADALEAKQKSEQDAVQARKDAVAKEPKEPKFAPSAADKGFVTKPVPEYKPVVEPISPAPLPV